MKKFSTASLVLLVLFATSCKKDPIQPSKPHHMEHLKQCKSCDGGVWDFDGPKDTIPQ